MEYLLRILRFLVSYDVFTESVHVVRGEEKQWNFGLTAISELLVQKGNQHSSQPFLLLAADKFGARGLAIFDSISDGQSSLWQLLCHNNYHRSCGSCTLNATPGRHCDVHLIHRRIVRRGSSRVQQRSSEGGNERN
eukprot:Gb_41580 [translate_table: standard]